MGADDNTNKGPAVDTAKVEAAVKYLKDIHMQGPLVAALAIGKYLLTTFFDGDITSYEAKGTLSPSFSALVRRPELQDYGLTGRTLRNYIRVYATDDLYPNEIREHLPLGHRIHLLAAPSEERVEIAKRAVAERLSNRAVKGLISPGLKSSGKQDKPDGTEPIPKSKRPTFKQLRGPTEDLLEAAWDLGDDDLVKYVEYVRPRWQRLVATLSTLQLVWNHNWAGESDEHLHPLLSYPGSKFLQLHALMGFLGRFAESATKGWVFCEPFTGSAIVAVNVLKAGLADRVRLNDADPVIATLLTTVIQDHEALRQRVLEQTEMTEEGFYKCKAVLDAGRAGPVDMSFAALAVHWTTHGGSGRKASGPRKYLLDHWNPARIAGRVEEFHQALKGRVVGNECTNLDALGVIQEPGRCLMVLDPPYVGRGQESYTHAFGVDQHQALAEALAETDKPWLLTYDDHPLVRKLYAAQVIKEVRGRYGSKNGSKGGAGIVELYICPQDHAYLLESPSEFEDPIADIPGPKEEEEAG